MEFIVSIVFASIFLFLIIQFFTGFYKQKNEEASTKTKIDVTESGAEFSDGPLVEVQKPDQPIPSKTYSSLDDWEKDTKVVWQMEGAPLKLEFTYEKWDRLEEKYVREQRSVNVEEIIKDSRNDFYLRGSCMARGGVRTFHLDRISTKILYKSRRYDPYEFIEKFDVF